MCGGGDYHNDYEIAYRVHKVAFLQHLTNKQQLFSVMFKIATVSVFFLFFFGLFDFFHFGTCVVFLNRRGVIHCKLDDLLTHSVCSK